MPRLLHAQRILYRSLSPLGRSITREYWESGAYCLLAMRLLGLRNSYTSMKTGVQILEKRMIGCSGYDKLSGLYASLLPRGNKKGVKMQLVCIRHPDIFRLESLGCSVPRFGTERFFSILGISIGSSRHMENSAP